MNAESPAFDAGFRRKAGGSLERLDELGTAVGIAGVVERVDADENVVGARAPRPRPARATASRCCARARRSREWREGPGQPFGTSPSPSSAEPPSDARSTADLAMRLDAQRLRHLSRRENFVSMTLAVLDRQRVNIEASSRAMAAAV